MTPLVYETSECAIVNFFIPTLALSEVQNARNALSGAVEVICGSNSRKFQIILDAPRYLFVSSNLAQLFPSLLESIIVSSYHSCTPGVFSKLWRFNQPYQAPWWAFWRSGNSHQGGKLFITTLILSALQHLGASSPTLQRLLIHGVQPLFVSAIFLVWVVLYRDPIWWAVVGPIMLGIVGALVWNHYRQSRSSSIRDDTDVDVLSKNIFPLVPDDVPAIQWEEEEEKGGQSGPRLEFPLPSSSCSSEEEESRSGRSSDGINDIQSQHALESSQDDISVGFLRDAQSSHEEHDDASSQFRSDYASSYKGDLTRRAEYPSSQEGEDAFPLEDASSQFRSDYASSQEGDSIRSVEYASSQEGEDAFPSQCRSDYASSQEGDLIRSAEYPSSQEGEEAL
jgi:hypothetical protein